MVVRINEGRDAVRAYIDENVAKGRDHVASLVAADIQKLMAMLDDLSEEEGRAVTPVDEWVSLSRDATPRQQHRA